MNAVNSSIIKELYDNTAIIGGDNRIIYMGAGFKKITGDIDLESLLKTSGEKVSFISKIEEIRQSGQTASFTFNNDGIELIISPSEEGILFISYSKELDDLIRLDHNLNERIKELQCLYSISSEMEKGLPFDEFINNIISIITDAFQYPDKTYVNIEIDNKNYGSSWLPSDTANKIKYTIHRNTKICGEIRVYGNDIEFLEEEEKLVNEIAVRISRLIERDEKQRNFEKQQRVLTSKNQALIKLTEECYEKREKLRTFFRAISDNIVVIDRDYNITMSNKDSIGESGKCYKKLFNENQICSNCTAHKTFTSAQDHWGDMEISKRNYRLRTYPIFGINGEVEKVLEVCRDTTDQKEIEIKLIQSYKLASLGKLVAGVAHEINNPNTFILGNLKIIQEAFEDIFPLLDRCYESNKDLHIARLDYEVFKENISILVNDMLNGANRTKKIVADLRNFAKKDEDLLTETVDLNYIIKNNLTLTQKHVKKYAKLDIELKENLPLFIGNVNKIEQVLLNLTMNASEAVENGDGLVKIKTDFDRRANEVILIVSDNGCGMNESTLKKIFDPFFTTKRNSGGTGLGLSITYGIIKDHNGYIDVKSEPGKGTTFIIHIPVKTEKDDDKNISN